MFRTELKAFTDKTTPQKLLHRCKKTLKYFVDVQSINKVLNRLQNIIKVDVQSINKVLNKCKNIIKVLHRSVGSTVAGVFSLSLCN